VHTVSLLSKGVPPFNPDHSWMERATHVDKSVDRDAIMLLGHEHLYSFMLLSFPWRYATVSVAINCVDDYAF
jgi:hypothetical protein